MKKLILILFLCLFTTNIFCEGNDLDGRWWQKLSQDSKLLFIMGLTNGYYMGMWSFGNNLEMKSEKIGEFITAINIFPSKYNYGEIIEFVDKFYLNPQYKILDIRMALQEILLPALKEGWSKEEIDKEALECIKFKLTN